MIPVSQSLEIINNNPVLKMRLAFFTELMQKGIDEGVSYQGYPAEVTRRTEGGSAFLRCKIEGESKPLFASIPKALFDAGYRFEQFGSLFIANFNFSNGAELFSSLKTNITAVLKSHSSPISGDHDIDGIILTIIGRIVKPVAQN